MCKITWIEDGETVEVEGIDFMETLALFQGGLKTLYGKFDTVEENKDGEKE